MFIPAHTIPGTETSSNQQTTLPIPTKNASESLCTLSP